MQQGIYILANDRVLEQTLALLKSIRLRDATTPIVLIPYNDQYQEIAQRVGPAYGVTVYDNLDFLQELDQLVEQTCGPQLFDRPNLLRKLACWFGPLERFLYIDTDIVVFERIADTLQYLEDYDFICSDYQHLGGIEQVFRPPIQAILTAETLADVFNTGFWGSKRELITWADVAATFQTCATQPDCFYLLNSDQTVLNYLVLKTIARRFNLVRLPGPGNWAGSGHFQRQGDRLFDPRLNQPLKFLHWAGVKIGPGCPYWEIWAHYRYLGEPMPEFSQPSPQPWWQRVFRLRVNR